MNWIIIIGAVAITLSLIGIGVQLVRIADYLESIKNKNNDSKIQ